MVEKCITLPFVSVWSKMWERKKVIVMLFCRWKIESLTACRHRNVFFTFFRNLVLDWNNLLDLKDCCSDMSKKSQKCVSLVTAFNHILAHLMFLFNQLNFYSITNTFVGRMNSVDQLCTSFPLHSTNDKNLTKLKEKLRRLFL